MSTVRYSPSSVAPICVRPSPMRWRGRGASPPACGGSICSRSRRSNSRRPISRASLVCGRRMRRRRTALRVAGRANTSRDWIGDAMMSSVVSSIFFFIVALGLLIAIHEFGHYWVARKLGVKVLRFSIGFGKPLWKTTRGADNTEYVVAAIPLGGYVRMLDEREGEVAPQELHRAFNRQSVRKRFGIVAAGPLFNFMLAIIAYWLVFLIGVTTVKPVVGTVAADSPAAQAGFASGDRIVAVDDELTPGWQSVAMALLEKSLDDGSVPVKVTEAAGQPQTRVLRISSVQKKLERGYLLNSLGIEPARPLLPPRLGNLEAGGAAAQAGMEVGDLIVSADGTAMQDWDRWVEYVRAHPQQIIRTEVERAGDRLTLELRPARLQ